MSCTEPRIYVGTYFKYNSGNTAGDWLTVGDYSDRDEFHDACKALHPTEEDPEFMFQDMEGIPEGMASESHVSEELFEYAAMDDDDQELLTVYRSEVNQGGTLEEAQEAFHGKYSSAADYCQEQTEEGEGVPEYLRSYIDYEAMARDWGHGGYSFVRHDGEYWVFSS